MAQTFRIEIGDGNNWRTCMNWSGMRKGQAKGVMMAVKELYSGQNSYRMVNEQDRSILTMREGQPIEGLTGFDFNPLIDQEDYFETLDRSPIEPHCRQSLKALFEMKQRLAAVESRIDELEQMPPWNEG